jgi:hypothetical protein
MSAKRLRTSSGFGSAQKKAYWANSKFSGLHPWSTYGAARLQRGSAVTLDTFGPTWKSATSEQRGNRKMTGYSGRGIYDGRGGFFKKHHVGRKMKNFAKKHHLGQAAIGAIALENPELALGLEMANQAHRQGRGSYSGRGALTSGRGMYDVQNSLIVGGRDSMQVNGGADDSQSVTITHKEYLQDIFGPADAGFQNSSWEINPGLALNFPWLAQMAANYEEYEMIQMVFEFRSTVDAASTNNPAGSTGTIVMAANYNPDASAFSTKVGMMEYHGAVSGRVTDNISLGVECDPSKNAGSAIKFTRTSPPSNNQSLKDFDLGKFQLALVNIPQAYENQQVGELWCYYTVKMGKPRLYNGLFRQLPRDQFLGAGANMSMSNPFGDNQVTPVAQSLGEVITTTMPTTTSQRVEIKFPDFMTGSFELMYCLTGSSLDYTVPPAWTTTGGCSLIKDIWIFGYEGSTGTQQSPESDFIVGNSNAYYVCIHFELAPVTAGVDSSLVLDQQFTSVPALRTAMLTNKAYNQAMGQLEQNNIVVYTPSGYIV